MATSYEKNIVEIREEYTRQLIDILTPLVYEGISSMYDYAKEVHGKLKEAGKTKTSTLKIFQGVLMRVPSWNQNIISQETDRIRKSSKCEDWFDDLVKAVVKSHIVLLTNAFSAKKCKPIQEKFHEKISVPDFIHKCYIQCAKSIYNNPYLFWEEGMSPLNMKKNQMDTFNILGKSIQTAIREMLPMKLTIQEFLGNDYREGSNKIDFENSVSKDSLNNLQKMVSKDLAETREGKQVGGSSGEKSKKNDKKEDKKLSEKKDKPKSEKKDEKAKSDKHIDIPKVPNIMNAQKKLSERLQDKKTMMERLGAKLIDDEKELMESESPLSPEKPNQREKNDRQRGGGDRVDRQSPRNERPERQDRDNRPNRPQREEERRSRQSREHDVKYDRPSKFNRQEADISRLLEASSIKEENPHDVSHKSENISFEIPQSGTNEDLNIQSIVNGIRGGTAPSVNVPKKDNKPKKPKKQEDPEAPLYASYMR
jgi:hypothetical protein